jgi:hypothetical protein
MDPETKRGIAILAEPFGQRRFGAVVRLAIRRLLAEPPANITELLTMRRDAEVVMVIAPVHLGDDLASQLTTFGQSLGFHRAELVRLACDKLLTDVATERLHGRPVDLTAEVTAEVYLGEANREKLIRRHLTKQTER